MDNMSDADNASDCKKKDIFKRDVFTMQRDVFIMKRDLCTLKRDQ